MKKRHQLNPTGDIELKKTIKVNRFLSLIRRNPGLSRLQCAKTLRMSMHSISVLSNTLVKKRMVLEAKPRLVGNGRGRPVVPLSVNAEYEYFAGIEFNADKWSFVIINFAGIIQLSCLEEIVPCNSRDEYHTQIALLLDKCLEKSGDLWEKVCMVGIGAPGFIDMKKGVIKDYHMLEGFQNIEIFKIASQRLKKDVCILHNISCLPIKDIAMHPESENKIIIYVMLKTGISSALSVYGKEYRGASSRSGELGFCLKSGRSFQDNYAIQQLRKQLQELPDSFWTGDPQVIDNALHNNHHVRKKIDAYLYELAEVLYNAMAMNDPHELRIVSELFSSDNLLCSMLKEHILALRREQGFGDVQIIFEKYPLVFGSKGAAFHAMNRKYPLIVSSLTP